MLIRVHVHVNRWSRIAQLAFHSKQKTLSDPRDRKKGFDIFPVFSLLPSHNFSLNYDKVIQLNKIHFLPISTMQFLLKNTSFSFPNTPKQGEETNTNDKLKKWPTLKANQSPPTGKFHSPPPFPPPIALGHFSAL